MSLATAYLGPLAIFLTLVAATSAAPTTDANLYSRAWLTQINQYRMMAGLESVEEVPAISAGDTNHARYLVKRFEVEPPEQVDIYSENRATGWSTPSGAAAASLSDIALRTGAEQPTDPETQIRQVIDDWMTDPFQRLPVLDPELHKVGLGVYSEKGFTSIVLQVRTPPPPEEALMGNAEDYRQAQEPAENSSKYPIMFPPAGSDIGLVAFEGGGWPDLFTSCPGLGLPVGLPITLALGPSAEDQNVLRHSITTNQKQLEHCIFIPGTYVGLNDGQTLIGRQVLRTFGAIVLIPRLPLRAGNSYSVSISTDRKEYRWSFSVR
jgi:Cysteine-rich secretory protein family